MAPVAGTPTSSAMRDARKNARIRPPALLNSIDYRLWPNNATILTQNRLALAGEESVSVGHRRQRLPGATRRTHPMRIYIIGNDGITLCREAPASVTDGEIAVASKEALHTAPLNGKRLLALWNA